MGEIVARSPLPAAPSVDIERLLFDLNSCFNPLHLDSKVDFHVSAVKDGYVFLSLALPEGMTRAYITLLESLNGLFRCVDIKSRSAAAQAKVLEPKAMAEVEEITAAFTAKVVSLFDGFIAQGMDRKEAIKRVNHALKAENEPWATHDVVTSTLRKAGKFRKRSRGLEHSR